MINRIVIVGRLTADPELRFTPSGVAVARFSLAVNRKYVNQNGEREVDFINIVTWRGLAETCANFLKKGRLIGVDGRLQISVYENQEGRKIRNAEVVAENIQFLEKSNHSNSEERQLDDPFAGNGNPIEIDDDSLPW